MLSCPVNHPASSPFVLAYASAGTGHSVVSEDNGATFSTHTIGTSISGGSLFYNGSVFAYFNNTSTDIAVSSDGSLWSEEANPITPGGTHNQSVSGNLFLDFQSSHTLTATPSITPQSSSDGLTWSNTGTITFAPFGTPLSSRVYLQSSSYDGSNILIIGIGQDLSAPGGSDYNWVLSAKSSNGGVSWTTQNQDISATCQAAGGSGGFLAWNGSVFCGGYGLITDGGVTKTDIYTFTSPDGITWTPRLVYSSPIPPNLRPDPLDICWNGNIFCIVGTRKSIFTSPDGITWTKQTAPAGISSTHDFYSISWNGSVFLAAGSSGETATSPDGITWTQGPSILGTSQVATNHLQFGTY